MSGISRAKRLKASTSQVHDGLDQTIMKAKPFSSRERYSQFVQMQQMFHRDIAALYEAPELLPLFDNLPQLRRSDAAIADLADLGASPLPEDGPPHFQTGQAVDIPTALGWLYVAEGSNLGAAFLLKAAAKIGLSEQFGARHLASSPEGRANAWRAFTAAMDLPAFSEEEEERVDEGARDAFRRVRSLVDRVYYPHLAQPA